MIEKLALGTSLAVLLAACGDGASNDATAEAGNVQTEGNSASSVPSGPFAEVEIRMHERMMAATGRNASETWARKMIEHHRGAVEMSQLLITQGGDPQMVDMARQTIEKQQREIGELERLVAAGINGGTGEANPFGSSEQRMHQSMMAAGGSNLSETWARKMIVHHQGAVDMSEALIRQGGNPQVLTIARRTAEDQRREIAHLEAMLRGEAMPTGAAEPTGATAARTETTSQPPAAPAGERQQAAPKAASTSRPSERPESAPQATERPEASPAPASTCTPEHEAMGHCKQ